MKERIVILPGWSNDALLWQYQLKDWEKIYDIQVCTIETENTIEKMANKILEQVTSPFHLIGHSLGGWIAAWIAIHAANSLQSLSLISTWPGNSTQQLLDVFSSIVKRLEAGERITLLDERRASAFFEKNPKINEVMTILKQSQNNMSLQGLINQTRAEIDSPAITEELSYIKTPTIIIHGIQDNYFPIATAKLLAEQIPNATLHLLDQCGHMPSVEKPKQVTQLVQQHLESFHCE